MGPGKFQIALVKSLTKSLNILIVFWKGFAIASKIVCCSRVELKTELII